MAKLSVIIPSRNEKFLPQTVADILQKARGDVEVFAVLDGGWPDPETTSHYELWLELCAADDPRLIILHRGKAQGMRAAINSSVAISHGEYLLKCDAHCMFAEGFDEVLKADIEDNWIVIPRRYSLNAEEWKYNDKEPIDAMHYFYPYAHPDDLGLHGRPWPDRARGRKDILIDEDVTFQGSCWFMTRSHFDWLGGLSEYGYETFMGEPQEIGFKTQLGERHGSIMRNKKTSYAHLHKGKQYGRMYSFSQSERVRGNAYSFDFWWNNRWTERVHDLEWLIDKFPTMPGWPSDWKDRKEELAERTSNEPISAEHVALSDE